MSIHRSLHSTGKLTLQRTVLKRPERLKKMMDEGRWKIGESVFGLPKIKVVRFKIKKAVKEEKPKTDTTATAPVASTEKSGETKKK
jgi:small basic protein (TIGR04137 family)